MNAEILNELVIGRVEPHIYAFSTAMLPGALKVGDTYRPVLMRLGEWKRHFSDLKKEYDGPAKVQGTDKYFRDYSVHEFLETSKKRHRLAEEEFPKGAYYSTEFFREATADDVREAVDVIQQDILAGKGTYQAYDVATRLSETHHYAGTETFAPRPNQQRTIDRFKEAVKSGRTNLLMYAVMRFGKSFTSLCCAVEQEYKLVVIVSAKADVREEWKRTVESHVKFKNYVFLDATSLMSEGIITHALESKGVVLFLTLQDLQGDEIKAKHKEVFEHAIDLLIVDETHFGARAEKYGQVLHALGKATANATQGKLDNEDFVEVAEADRQLKVLKAKVTLHLSGTPYRILMSSEFEKEDVIAFCQFSDIVDAQAEWDGSHILDDGVKEWDNPYFGFPQMLRFAFHPNESSRKRLRDLREQGVSFAFSELLRTVSLSTSDRAGSRTFKYEQEVLDLLRVIDGSKDDSELFGFLDDDRIKTGQMCHHMVMVLPFCASCDAMEKLLVNHSSLFKNLQNYEVLNISGLGERKAFKTSLLVREYIRHAEEEGKKTLTLTVNRMLTGSTVEEWDTMLFMKDTASPQEYDQAIFRLQNAYVKRYVDGKGHVIRRCMKPQTLLVDFDPDRMFAMQETKAQIYNANVTEAGNHKLQERLEKELKISPIIAVNAGRMTQVTAKNVMDAVSAYSRTRGVAEVTQEIPVDLSLLQYDAIRMAIVQENELGSKSGLTINPAADEGHDLDTEGISGAESTDASESSASDASVASEGGASGDEAEDEQRSVKQFRSYYARILFFAFLSRDTIISLADIIAAIGSGENARIARNIGLSKKVLMSMEEHINLFVLHDLDYKIQHLNRLAKDKTLSPLERADVAVHKFGRLGISEVITPHAVCAEMVGLLPDSAFHSAVAQGRKFLDLAGKAGEFALALYRRFEGLHYGPSQIRDAIYTIPTSGLAYEFTRMIYEILGLNPDAIASRITSYDLVEHQGKDGHAGHAGPCVIPAHGRKFSELTIEDIQRAGGDNVIFEAVLGNPPYQLGTNQTNRQAVPIYQHFVSRAKQLSSRFVCLIMPSRWFAGGLGLDEFRASMCADSHILKIVDYINAKDCFPTTSISGGVCYFLSDVERSNHDKCSFVSKSKQGEIVMSRSLREFPIVIRYNEAISILRKVTYEKGRMSEQVSSISPFGITTKVRGQNVKDRQHAYALYASNGVSYLAKRDIPKGEEYLDRYKIIISQLSAEHAGEPSQAGSYRVLTSSMQVIGPRDVCTHSYLIAGASETKKTVENTLKYLKTQFARFLMLMPLTSIHITKSTFSFVPAQDFSEHSEIDWNGSVAEIDRSLFQKYHLDGTEIAFIQQKIRPLI